MAERKGWPHRAGGGRNAAMMYRREGQRELAISQPAHAWISGQLLRRFAAPLTETLLLAGEQHDLGWLDWERAPSFDPRAGRPPSFREVGAVEHTPMWTAGVERALAAWGPEVALLISRHGGRIYRRFGLPSAGPEDARAIHAYLEAQAPREEAWAAASGLNAAEIDRRSELIAFVDALSLAVCGALRTPVTLDLPGGEVRVAEAGPYDLRLSPWPFAGAAFEIQGQGRLLPPGGRFADEAAMRAWIASPERESFRTRLAPG
jgi:hypothetical protein